MLCVENQHITSSKKRLTSFIWVSFLLKRLSIAFLLSLVIISFGLAQTATDANNSQSLALQVSNLEQSYDSQIYLLLANYFDRKKFFVDVNIDAEFVDETIETTQNQIVRNQSQPVIMPGLPFLPQENLRESATAGTPETVINQSTVRSLQLNSIAVSIYADTSFTAQEVQFMRLLTGIASKIDESRGDVITISQISIPRFGTEDPIRIVETQPETFNLVASFREYIPGFVLLLLFGLIMFVNSFFNRPKETISPIQQRESIKHDINITDLGARRVEQVMVGSSDGDISQEINELIQSFFNKPQEIALLFEYWMAENPEEGVLRAAEVACSVDKHLLRTLKSDMQPENYEAISKLADEMPPLTSDVKGTVIRKFNTMLKSGSAESMNARKSGHITLFKFLEHINEQQIVKLIGDEGHQTGALVLDYLPEEKAASVLKKLSPTQSTNLMLKMTTVGTLPFQLQNEISTRLFDKAMDLIEEEKEQKLGAENILPVLEKLPLNEQQKYIDQLKASNAAVGDIIEGQFITIDQVINITDNIIKEALKDLNTATLLDAIVDLDPKLIDKILSVRARREQRLIRLELDEIKGRPYKDTEVVKKQMMELIRKEVRKSRED
ncbi:MAG: hypothetical protein ED557_02825 [Balneola sp.]|nr:MAG: hypothetical protein ED557_02825 [Balneola sp.]